MRYENFTQENAKCDISRLQKIIIASYLKSFANFQESILFTLILVHSDAFPFDSSIEFFWKLLE